MSKILITGANSYIGTHVSKWITNHQENMIVDTIDMCGDDWRQYSFSGYDSVFHVAGIAHADVSHVDEATKQKYYDVNCHLAADCAAKAKSEGVGQFIFMSSMIVFHGSEQYGKPNIITSETKPCPDNFYGDSKLQAEIRLNGMRDETFKVVILRPPMIYGRDSKGNYRMLSKIARKFLVFPKVKNQRSMLYVENLCEFVRLMIINKEDGTFYPQNGEYTNTSAMVAAIRQCSGRKMHLTGVFNWAIFLLSKCPGKIGKIVNKAFGSMTYDLSMSQYKDNYRVCNLEESIQRTEG